MTCFIFFQPIESWNVTNVIEWMAAVNLYRYSQIFKRYNVDGQKLSALEESQLMVGVATCAYFINFHSCLSFNISASSTLSLNCKQGGKQQMFLT